MNSKEEIGQSKLVAESVGSTANVADAEEEMEDEEEYVEEAEPILSYSRMKNDVLKILEQDSVSCIRAGHKVLDIHKNR